MKWCAYCIILLREGRQNKMPLYHMASLFSQGISTPLHTISSYISYHILLFFILNNLICSFLWGDAEDDDERLDNGYTSSSHFTLPSSPSNHPEAMCIVHSALYTLFVSKQSKVKSSSSSSWINGWDKMMMMRWVWVMLLIFFYFFISFFLFAFQQKAHLTIHE